MKIHSDYINALSEFLETSFDAYRVYVGTYLVLTDQGPLVLSINCNHKPSGEDVQNLTPGDLTMFHFIHDDCTVIKAARALYHDLIKTDAFGRPRKGSMNFLATLSPIQKKWIEVCRKTKTSV